MDNPLLRNILAVVIGLIIGSLVNMGIVMLGPHVIPYPEGYDGTTVDNMKEGFHLLSSKDFIMPWLAHALGTLSGAVVATKIALTRHLTMALIIGCFFLLGGISVISMIPSPTWFTIMDLVGAYIPMAYLGYIIGKKQV